MPLTFYQHSEQGQRKKEAKPQKIFAMKLQFYTVVCVSRFRIHLRNANEKD